MLHVVGVTPEAPTLASATGGVSPRLVRVTTDTITRAYQDLSNTGAENLRTVNLGTPHYSARQIARLQDLLAGRRIHPDVTLYVNTGRDVLASSSDIVKRLEEAGAVFVVDTCTYVTSILPAGAGVAMTDSAKWAYYAPGNLGVDVVFGSASDCVESAVAGRVIRGRPPW